MAKTFSGQEVVRVLGREFGFRIVSRKGSQVKLRRRSDGRTLTTIVPLHRELAHGTLLGLLKLAEITAEAFRRSV